MLSVGAAAPAPAGEDSGGLRLVTRRSLWDAGTGVAHSPSLAGLHPDWAAAAHPGEVAIAGVASGSVVTLRSSRGGLAAPLVADDRVPPGVVVVPFNLPGGSASGLIDAAVGSVTVRIDPVGGGAA
jgi:anaerobic selenocysteine-containing dehydrogenase